MSIRRDKKGRALHTGESLLADGRYRYKYHDLSGRVRVVYSRRLDPTDPVPPQKRSAPSLRELERQIQADLYDNIAVRGGNYTVIKLVEKYIKTKFAVRPTTAKGYKTVVNILKKDPFGSQRIDNIRISDAKCWLIKLQQVDGRGYSSIHTIRGVLKPAFQMAVDDDLLRKNPFGFQLADVLINDSKKRQALTPEEERKFLEFVKADPHFSKYYDGIYILFKTGLRISEFCGLTIRDINFKYHSINIDHQLMKDGSRGYYIQKTKTSCGTRLIPMTPDVEECFRRIISNRKPPRQEPVIDGYMGFLHFDANGSVVYSLHWEHYFKSIRDKYNRMNEVPIPTITPHVCRHTYCSNMAKNGINVKTLQYLMGHAEIGVTLNTYTHVGYEDAKAEISKIKIV